MPLAILFSFSSFTVNMETIKHRLETAILSLVLFFRGTDSNTVRCRNQVKIGVKKKKQQKNKNNPAFLDIIGYVFYRLDI